MAASLVTTSRVQGFIVPDHRIAEDTIADIGAGTTDSSYTQAGARAGVPEADQDSSMVWSASGTPTDQGDIELVILRSGHAGPEEGGFGFRDVAAGDTTSQISGWDGYQVITGMEGLWRFSGAGAGGSLTTAVRLPNGKIAAAFQDAQTASGRIQLKVYDPATGAWSTTAVTPASWSDLTQPCPCLVALPTGRLLMFLASTDGRNLDMVFTDDDSTWQDGAARVLNTDLPDGCTINSVRAAYNGGQIVLFVQYTPTGGASEEIAQYGSTSSGARFDQVASAWGVAGEDPEAISVTALQGGGFLLVYDDGDGTPADRRYQSRYLGSPFDDVQNADAVDVTTTRVTDGRPSCAVWQDEDGIVYVIVALDDGGSSRATSILRTLDRGTSWEEYGGPLAELEPGANAAELNDFAVASSGGLAILVSKYTAAGDGEDNSAVIALYLGGYTDHTVPATDEDVGGVPLSNFPDTAYITWAESDDGGKMGGVYLPLEAPGGTGWTAAGGGSEAITADQELEVTTTPVNGRFYSRAYPESSSSLAVDGLIVEFEAQLDAGAGDKTTLECACRLTLSDGVFGGGVGTYTYRVSVRLEADGWELWDEMAGAKVGATVTVDLTDYVVIRIEIDSGGNVSTRYCSHGHRRQWTAGPASTGLTNTAAAVDNGIEWGHILATTVGCVSRWKPVRYCGWCYRHGPRSTTQVGSGWSNPESLHPIPVPVLPRLLHDGNRVAATGGAGYLDETWRLRPTYEHGVANLFPATCSSPRRTWRSTQVAAQEHIVFPLDADFTEALLLNGTLGILLLNSNLELAYLDGYDGGSWHVLATLDSTSDWTALDYERRGRDLVPNTGGSAAGSQHFNYHAHVGDTFDLNKGTADDLHRIRFNTEGDWRSAGTGKRPKIVLADANMPGALADTDTGIGVLRRKDFGEIVHSYTQDYYLLRLRIPIQATAEGYFEIGTLVIGHLVAFAHQYDKGWSVIHEHDAEVYRRRGGVRRARRNGPPRRVVEIAWSNSAVNAQQAQKKTPDCDYIIGQTGTAVAIGAPSDTLHTVIGAIEAVEGPVLPVVYLPRVVTDSSSSHSLTRPGDFIFGRIETNPRLNHVTGDERSTEMNRMETVTLREDV